VAKTKIETRERKVKDRFWIVEIDPFFDPADRRRGFRGKLSVVSSYEMGELKGDAWEYAWCAAKINCSSWSDGTAEEMLVMVEALTIAARYAKQMDEEHKIEVTKC
jgi:hypothetical protein